MKLLVTICIVMTMAKETSLAVDTHSSDVTKKASPAEKPVSIEQETYEGKLFANDSSFTLHFYRNGACRIEFLPKGKYGEHLDGTYTGEEGNYAATFPLSDDTEKKPSRLSLNMKATGGMESATYTITGSVLRHEIPDIRLSSVYAPDLQTPSVKRKSAPARKYSTGTHKPPIRRKTPKRPRVFTTPGIRYYGF